MGDPVSNWKSLFSTEIKQCRPTTMAVQLIKYDSATFHQSGRGQHYRFSNQMAESGCSMICLQKSPEEEEARARYSVTA